MAVTKIVIIFAHEIQKSIKKNIQLQELLTQKSSIMAIVKPFRGVRPPKQYVEEIESRPYDVLDSEEARKEAEGNEKSLYRSEEHTV